MGAPRERSGQVPPQTPPSISMSSSLPSTSPSSVPLAHDPNGLLNGLHDPSMSMTREQNMSSSSTSTASSPSAAGMPYSRKRSSGHGRSIESAMQNQQAPNSMGAGARAGSQSRTHSRSPSADVAVSPQDPKRRVSPSGETMTVDDIGNLRLPISASRSPSSPSGSSPGEPSTSTNTGPSTTSPVTNLTAAPFRLPLRRLTRPHHPTLTDIPSFNHHGQTQPAAAPLASQSRVSAAQHAVSYGMIGINPSGSRPPANVATYSPISFGSPANVDIGTNAGPAGITDARQQRPSVNVPPRQQPQESSRISAVNFVLEPTFLPNPGHTNSPESFERWYTFHNPPQVLPRRSERLADENTDWSHLTEFGPISSHMWPAGQQQQQPQQQSRGLQDPITAEEETTADQNNVGSSGIAGGSEPGVADDSAPDMGAESTPEARIGANRDEGASQRPHPDTILSRNSQASSSARVVDLVPELRAPTERTLPDNGSVSGQQGLSRSWGVVSNADPSVRASPGTSVHRIVPGSLGVGDAAVPPRLPDGQSQRNPTGDLLTGNAAHRQAHRHSQQRTLPENERYLSLHQVHLSNQGPQPPLPPQQQDPLYGTQSQRQLNTQQQQQGWHEAWHAREQTAADSWEQRYYERRALLAEQAWIRRAQLELAQYHSHHQQVQQVPVPSQVQQQQAMAVQEQEQTDYPGGPLSQETAGSGAAPGGSNYGINGPLPHGGTWNIHQRQMQESSSSARTAPFPGYYSTQQLNRGRAPSQPGVNGPSSHQAGGPTMAGNMRETDQRPAHNHIRNGGHGLHPGPLPVSSMGNLQQGPVPFTNLMRYHREAIDPAAHGTGTVPSGSATFAGSMSSSQPSVTAIPGFRPVRSVDRSRLFQPNVSSRFVLTADMSRTERRRSLASSLLRRVKWSELPAGPIDDVTSTQKDANKDSYSWEQRVIEREESCPVCQDDYEPDSMVAVTPCQHMYHEDCLNTWLATPAASTCPMCRRDLAALGVLCRLTAEGNGPPYDLWMNTPSNTGPRR